MNDRDYEKEIENLNKDATRLLELYKKDKEKINKAIEYIEKEKVIKEGNTLEQITNYEKNILEILKGEDKE